MVDPKQLESPEIDKKRHRVEFTAYGTVFQVVYFDSAEAAKAHALSFVSVEPKFEDGGLTAALGRTAVRLADD